MFTRVAAVLMTDDAGSGLRIPTGAVFRQFRLAHAEPQTPRELMVAALEVGQREGWRPYAFLFEHDPAWRMLVFHGWSKAPSFDLRGKKSPHPWHKDLRAGDLVGFHRADGGFGQGIVSGREHSGLWKIQTIGAGEVSVHPTQLYGLDEN